MKTIGPPRDTGEALFVPKPPTRFSEFGGACPCRQVASVRGECYHGPMTEARSTEHRVTWDSGTATFHCDGDQGSPCRRYPSCGCRVWDEGCRAQGHKTESHDECWELPWLNAGDVDETYYTNRAKDAWEYGDPAPRRDGPIETTWEGDYLSWRYAAEETR